MKNQAKEAYFERIKSLANINNNPINENKSIESGTLIDYKRASNGIAYGIIKESHNYYVKKGGTKTDPDIADFAYIGGLSNITEYQYKSLSEAEKQRNLIIGTVNDISKFKINPNGGKVKINEDLAGTEIEKAEDKLGDLDTATAAETDDSGEQDMAAGLEAEPPSPEGMEPAQPEPELPEPEVSEPTDGEIPTEEPDTEVPEPEGGEEDDEHKEIEKGIGKLTSTIRKTDLTPEEIKSYVNSFLSSFKDKFKDVEIEDRKEMANRILKVVPPEEIEDLSKSVPDDEIEESDECEECGSFANYAKSRGYDSADSLKECGQNELSNLVSGYANAHNDGMNDGDAENVALIIKIINPNVMDDLKNDYGQDDYVEELEPHVNSMNECNESDGMAKIDELFGGLKSLGRAAGQAIGRGAQQFGQAVGQAAQDVKRTYHQGEVSGEVKKLENIANDLGAQIVSLNSRLAKAGQEPVNTQKLLAGLSNQLRAGKTASVGGTNVGAGIRTEQNDPAYVEAQPPIIKPGFQTLGCDVIKPNGAQIEYESINESKKNVDEKWGKDVEIEKTGEHADKTVAELKKQLNALKEKSKKYQDEGKAVPKNIIEKEREITFAIRSKQGWKKSIKESVDEKEMSEFETKLRKYVNARLKEEFGITKSSLNESVKSPGIKKIDNLIREQLAKLSNK